MKNTLCKGYLFFKVNKKYFMSYKDAREYKNKITAGEINFSGFYLPKMRWECFFYANNYFCKNKDVKHG